MVQDMDARADDASGGWLTDTESKRVVGEHIREAAMALQEGSANHRFAASTDYDVVLANGTRLPPKALFGVAAGLL